MCATIDQSSPYLYPSTCNRWCSSTVAFLTIILPADCNNRLNAEWRDLCSNLLPSNPFKKPCYLFALVAGDLASIKDTFTTKSNRKVNLEIYAFKQDIDKSIEIFEKKLNYNPIFFSYPFGEYSLEQKNFIKKKFKYAFGQHSGVIDSTKDKYELPRFPINEKYGEIKRFKRLLKTIPFPYKKITPLEKYIKDNNNPPEVNIYFFENGLNIENINCYSNEQDRWRKSKLHFHKKNQLKIILDGKFTTERGRINCSLWEEGGYWRWLGIQFVIADL